MSQAPLAERLRPQSINDVIGQEHLLGPGKPLRLAFESGQPHSMILWGPPGVGKTTLARLMANAFDAEFIALSAVLSGVKDIREAVERAQYIRIHTNRRTILFVDEVHRFNKSQQDAFLPHVESGLFIFIGATTENPSFEVNNALLSRATVYILKSLNAEHLKQLIERALEKELTTISMTDDARNMLIDSADGDARKLLNLLDLSAQAAIQQQTKITSALLKETLGDAFRRFDNKGDGFYDQISALHKSVRGSHPNAALYWYARMLDGGADPRYIARRVIRMAWEDIGLADPRAAQIANEAAATYERLGSPEGELAIAQAIIYLSIAAKSNAGEIAYNSVRAFVKRDRTREVPIHLRNAPTKLMKELGYGRTYRYAHDEPNAYAAGETYFPEGMDEIPFYQPTRYGLEKKIQEKIAWLAELDKQALNKNRKN